MPSQTVEFNTIRYTISMEALSWEEANRKCSKHGYLAIIDSINEATALVELSGRKSYKLFISIATTKSVYFILRVSQFVDRSYL